MGKHFKDRIKKITSLVVTAVFLCMLIPAMPVRAASAWASVDNVSGEAGSEVTIRVNISADTEVGAAQIYLSYDPECIQPVSGDMTYNGGTITLADIGTPFTSKTLTFTVKILKVGSSQIVVGEGSRTASMEDGNVIKISGGSGTVTGTAPVTYSTDNNLSSLSISPGVLSPAFSPNVTSYTTSVDADCTKLVVSAVTSDSNATVSVSGANLDPGSNTTYVRVTAQSGDVKTYTIYTTRGESETETTGEDASEDGKVSEQNVKVNGLAYKIIADLSEHPLPSGYEEIEYDYNETKVKAGRGINTKLILMYLESIDGNGQSGFYIYDSVAKTFTLYSEVAQPDITYVILPITDSMEKPDGLVLTEHNINGITYKVLMSSDRSYCVFYGISSLGVTGWYKYDLNDKTIQTYSVVSTNALTDKSTETTAEPADRMWIYIAIAAIVAAAILFIMVCVLMLKLSRNKKASVASVDEYDSEDDLNNMSYNEDEDILIDSEDSYNNDENITHDSEDSEFKDRKFEVGELEVEELEKEKIENEDLEEIEILDITDLYDEDK